MIILQLIFWLSLVLVFWTYLGYYIFLFILSSLKTRPIDRKIYIPNISLVITAHNEEKRIRQKLENSLSLEYPPEKLEIIVVSDGSTDCTNEIVKSYEYKGVRLLEIPGRHGKHYCQGQGIQSAQHDIIVLTDATTFMSPDAIRMIAPNFADSKIGCVSGIDRIQNANGNSGEGAYVRYEMKLRLLESQVNSLVSASGSFYAVRKKLCASWYPDMSADFYLPILSHMSGYRSILEAKAVGYYDILEDSNKEYQRKVRTVVHGLDVLFRFKSALNPFRYGLFSIQLISHKLIRWLVPLCLLALFATNMALMPSATIYRIFLIAQIIFYGAAFISMMIHRLQSLNLFKIPFYFSMANLSILVAWGRYLQGERYVTWDATKR